MLIETLPEIPVFHDLTPDQIEELSSWLQRRQYGPGEVLFAEGSMSDDLLIVLRGSVEVVFATPAGPLQLAELQAPCVAGEMGFLNQEPHSAAVRTTSAIIAAVLPRDVFEMRLAENNLTALRIALNLGKVVSQRLRSTTAELVRLNEHCAELQHREPATRRVSQRVSQLCKNAIRGAQK